MSTSTINPVNYAGGSTLVAGGYVSIIDGSTYFNSLGIGSLSDVLKLTLNVATFLRI
jgi:hypothetical protein